MSKAPVPGAAPRCIGLMAALYYGPPMNETLTIRLRDSQVVTLDRADFAVYRRNGRDLIPLFAPPR
jgi:hypothetical protein